MENSVVLAHMKASMNRHIDYMTQRLLSQASVPVTNIYRAHDFITDRTVYWVRVEGEDYKLTHDQLLNFLDPWRHYQKED